MTDEIALLYDEIQSLLDEPVAADPELLARLEHTLTEGYARALELEAESLRLERRIREVSADVTAHERRGGELAELAQRLSHSTRELGRLRAVLEALRARGSEIRAA